MRRPQIKIHKGHASEVRNGIESGVTQTCSHLVGKRGIRQLNKHHRTDVTADVGLTWLLVSTTAATIAKGVI